MSRGLQVGDGTVISKEVLGQLFDLLATVIALFHWIGDVKAMAASPGVSHIIIFCFVFVLAEPDAHIYSDAWLLSVCTPLVKEIYNIFLISTFFISKLICMCSISLSLSLFLQMWQEAETERTFPLTHVLRCGIQFCACADDHILQCPFRCYSVSVWRAQHHLFCISYPATPSRKWQSEAQFYYVNF